MKRCSCLISVFSIWFLLFRVLPATSAQHTVHGVEFPRAITLEDQMLPLRGTAMLRWAMFVDLYAGAFYMPASVPAEDWDRDVARYLELCYFREIPARAFVGSSQDHLQSTLPAEELAGLQPRLDEFYRLFRDVEAGDRYGLTYKPGVGTTLSLNDEPLGTVAGSDFGRAYFGIWLGEKPLQKKFRDRVLGISGS